MGPKGKAPVTLRSILRTSPNGRFSGLPLGLLPGANIRLVSGEGNAPVLRNRERQTTSNIVIVYLRSSYQQKSGLSTAFVHMGVFTSF